MLAIRLSRAPRKKTRATARKIATKALKLDGMIKKKGKHVNDPLVEYAQASSTVELTCDTEPQLVMVDGDVVSGLALSKGCDASSPNAIWSTPSDHPRPRLPPPRRSRGARRCINRITREPGRRLCAAEKTRREPKTNAAAETPTAEGSACGTGYASEWAPCSVSSSYRACSFVVGVHTVSRETIVRVLSRGGGGGGIIYGRS